MKIPKGTDLLVESRLAELLVKIENEMKADVLVYVGPLAFGADDQIREFVEDLRYHTRSPRHQKLVFILETSGGYAEQARRISDTLRHHYLEVDFLIPSHAMSAGTILALSGNAIWMDNYSVLGPIDPQVPSQDQRKMVPALGYLERYQELIDKANNGQASAAELSILFDFDQGELYAYRQARDLSVALLEEWLVEYEFKNWKETRTRKVKVTKKLRKSRAREIAKKLNDIKRWNSHGIGINMHLLRTELKLKIDDYGKIGILNSAVREYHKLLLDFLQIMEYEVVVQTRVNFKGFRY